MSEEVLACVEPSKARRWFGVGCFVVLAFILVLIAINAPSRNLWASGFLAVVGLCALWMAWKMYHETAVDIELTETELKDTRGHRLTALSNIARVEKGMFAFKPTGGFILHLKQPIPRKWAPGLWWSTGRKIGVGGITHRHQTKLMAELIDAKKDVRD
ncbi:hypothetical protein [Pseudaestuariivita rosea]|uniref:hypothetical protein n=1 Tax=Pseudaestuariivita rosea TaxID=2763263 RepID=UPI001ABB13F7|nr:hypothetical protein [Pseudaestuariivita rosea]